MSSRRVMQRSYSGDGRTGLNNADDVSGRPAGRSYLSNVRPESRTMQLNVMTLFRSTLCSVMAQLAEETQPTFELTLRSRAVSEECKVTFTCEVRGHPIPDVIWYKDDVQLDRYCGLPKYEIFRNGPNHSLHIYNCTMEDAAIYQASASNTKGIVSCSGVLEVGLMNEYLIHQRYFAKLKQKAEIRRRELEGRENQGVAEQDPLRNLSPERSQRKRRSSMAPHFSAPGSMEEAPKTTGERHEVPGPGAEAVVEARLQDSTAGETVAKPALVANGTPAAPAVNGHAGVTENRGKGNTYVYDSVQKVFTAYQPKTPFGKKNIKISNNVEGMKENAPVEGVSKERSSNVRACETHARTELVNTQGPLEEVMESSPPFTPLDSAPPVNTEPSQKRTTETALSVDKTPSKKDKISLDGASAHLEGPESATQKENPVPTTRPVNASPAGTLRKHHGVHGTESKQDKLVRQERVGHGDTKKTCLDLRSQKSPQVSPAQRQPTHVATPKQPLSSNQKQKDIQRSGVTAVDIAIGPTATELQTQSTAPTSCTTVNMASSLPAVRPIKPPDSPRPRRQGTTLQRCLSAGDAEDAFHRSPGEQGCRKETKPCLENVSMSEPQQLAEVTQAHAQPNRTGAPVGLKSPAPRRAVDAPSPHRTPSEEETVTAGGQMPIAHHPVQGTRRTARDHSRGSSEHNSVHFTDPATFPDEGLGYGQSSPGCNVSHAIKHSGASAVKTEEGLDVPLEGKVEGHQAGTLLVCEERRALTQRKVEMEVDVVALNEIEKAQIGATLDESQKETVSITHAGVSHTEIKNEPVLKSTVETHPIIHKTNITGFDTRNQQVTMEPRSINVPDTNVSEQINRLKESHKPGPKVLSVAEMMRSQIKALDSTTSNPFTAETNSATAESIASTPLFASSTKNEAATETFPDLREELEKVHDMERALAIAVEDKIKTKPPEQPPKPTPSTTEAIAAFNIPPHREDNSTAQDLERTIEIEQRLEAIPVSTPAVLDTMEKQFGFQPRINPTECTPEQPQTPTAPTTEVLTSLTRGEDIGMGLDMERTIEIEMEPKIDPNSASTPEVSDTTVKQFEIPPRINQQTTTECTADSPLTPTAPTSEVILSFSIPPITVRDIADTGNTGNSGMENDGIMDTGHESPPMSSSNDDAPLQEAKSDALTFSSATPKELALGARRKILIPKSKTVEDNPTSPTAVDSQLQSDEVLLKPSKVLPGAATLSVPPGPSQQSLLAVEPNGQRTLPVRRRSPLLSRKAVAQETPAAEKEALQQTQAPRSKEKSAEKEKHDPFKAPQVIRKIRGESFSDASGHLKLWCQFFNVLSDSVISWYRDDVEVAQVKRSAGDETPVNLAIVQASKKDCGVYGCKITNDHGTDITDLLLSVEILGGMRLHEDLGVGEEIEMTPLLLNKGVADSGVWGSKFFGRVMVQESHIGGGCSRKTWRAKVVYGLEPVFESGTTCVIKMCNRISYGGKGEAQLTERNVEMERQKCRIQSLAREYCKIFSAESRVIENFGPCLEVIPVYLMYRPANTVPYATVEADLKGVYLKYCKLSAGVGLVSRTGSEVELKCCALQHWIHQWTNGNLLLTQLEGRTWSLDLLIVSAQETVGLALYQGLSAIGNPDLLEQFVSQHQCNYYCGLLGLRSLKTTDSLQMPSSKSRGSKSPLLQRKTAAGTHSPGTARRPALSPRLPRKADGEQDRSQSPMKPKDDSPSNITS
ncbi:unnamed protein product [Lota lota]